jgi:NitT/TauT family transport system substrate-binding protein
LKRKRIGFTPGTTSDFFLDSLLTANGLTRQEIEPAALKPEEMQDAIMAKKVDAVSTWNYPLTQISRLLGADGMVFYDKEIYTETFNIASRQDFVLKNPDAVRRFLRALIKAEDFVANNPDEAQTIMSSATKIDKDLIHEVWNDFNYHVVLDQTLLITLEDETRWAMKNKLTDQTVMPDYLSFIDLDSLKAIKPEAIRMNR